MRKNYCDRCLKQERYLTYVSLDSAWRWLDKPKTSFELCDDCNQKFIRISKNFLNEKAS